ncbi:MAG TPA: hypothetical protein VJ417_05955 [Candidatus Glassbacteria bacterium]|nr:hypothetical protein [Candidatus Glassbacteria bacterium]
MNCRHCGTEIRQNTIICPVCFHQQNLSLLERLVEKFKALLAARNVRKRSPLF